MRARKTYYYSDEMNDDFAATKDIGGEPVGEDFPCSHDWIVPNILWSMDFLPVRIMPYLFI